MHFAIAAAFETEKTENRMNRVFENDLQVIKELTFWSCSIEKECTV